MDAKDRLIFALDTPTVEEAKALYDELSGFVSFYKIGLELSLRGGIDLARHIKENGHRVFLDFKFWDIERTVYAVCSDIAHYNFDFLTVHADPPTLRGASAALKGSATQLLGVTLLSGMTRTDIAEAGLQGDESNLINRLVSMSAKWGAAGVVVSGHNLITATLTAHEVGFERCTMVVPGIRPVDADKHDQALVLTPSEAVRQGADFLVVGRPIRLASDRRKAAMNIVSEIERGSPVPY